MRRFLESIPPKATFWFLVGCWLIGIFSNKLLKLAMIGWGLLIIAAFMCVVEYTKEIKAYKALVQNGICHRMSEDGIKERLGKKLVTVKDMKWKVVLATVFQVFAVVYSLVILFALRWKYNGFEVYMPILVIIAFLLGLLPLRYWNKTMDFYENGFDYCGEIYLYEQVGYPQFCRVSTGGSMDMMYMHLKSVSLNISYLRKVSEEYTKTYMKSVK